jgi:phage pi2 protein 07
MTDFKGYNVHINDLFDITKEQLTAEGLIAVYKGILEKTSTIAIAKRIQYAFENGNGVNFWQNFFLCDEIHRKKGYVIYHVLTKQQLVILQYWWKQMMDTADQTTKTNLEENRKEFFGTHPDMNTQAIGISQGTLETLYVYYPDKKFNARRPELKRLMFDKVPPATTDKKKQLYIGIDFFTDIISASDPANDMEEIAITDRNTVLRKMFYSLKNDLQPKIKSIFKKEYKFKDAWLLYLGKLNYTHKWIGYCNTFDPACPLIKAYFS